MGIQFSVGGYAYLHVGFIFLGVLGFCEAGLTSSYVRNNGLSQDMPLDSDVFKEPPGYNAPQQGHITQGDHEGKGVIVSWITPDEPGSNSVLYWPANSRIKKTAHGVVVKYTYYNYTSGYIHHCTIKNLDYDTKYYYELGAGNVTRQFWFLTPPQPGPDVPYTFGLIGDLGQTYDSNRTLTHYELNPVKGQTLLFVGDLSYADSYPLHDNTRWDTWGRFIERSAAYQPWIWTAGNHEIDFVPEIGETKPFKPYKHRFFIPYKASQSTSPLWYSIKRASAYIIVISSYSAYGKYTPQNKWIENELPKVNRTETPWLIVLMHCPMYSSYVHHYMEGETMRVMYEPWFVQYKVDVVFAGHVHAYERSERISNIRYNVVNGFCTPITDDSAPVYITIGDGGNQEGLVKEMTQPQPEYSAYREASYGHGIFDIKNSTHAYFGWHRNQDGFAVEADSLWFVNRYWKSIEETSVAVK
ncbi:purple acid phosphatase 2-like isoform X1 [Sesamum indicum]|uniref:Purple acid phosphatase n=1 Tax=Sesamum indicum TaxID=4182 RepID=A0A6I9TEW0_SESIN|nr:purple acid phosphatase 2-like isoform X1 [Sesamum indicum]